MSEKISKAAGQVETDKTFIQKAMETFATPVGKALAIGSIVLTGLGVTKDAVADTVACVTKADGETWPSLLVDRMGLDNNVGDSCCVESRVDSGVSILDGKIFNYYRNGEYKIYNSELDEIGYAITPTNPETNNRYDIGESFIGETDLRVGAYSTQGGRFFQFKSKNDPQELYDIVPKGFVEKAGSMIAYGDYVFMESTGDTESSAMISAIARTSIENSVVSSGVPDVNKVKMDDIIVGSGGAFFVDETTNQIIYSYKKGLQYGYREIDVDPSTWESGGIGEFIPTGIDSKGGCIDKETGDRYFLTSNNGIKILTESAVYTVPTSDLSGSTILFVRSLQDGGVLIAEDGISVTKTIRLIEGVVVVTQSPDLLNPNQYPINDCAVFEEDPYIDPCIVNPDSEGCQIGDNATSEDVVEPYDANITDTSDGVDSDISEPDVEQDIVEPSEDIPSTDEGTDTQYDVSPDVIEDTGTDSQEEVSSDLITTDTSTDEGGRDTVQTDIVTPDNEADGSTEPVDAIDTDTTVEGGKGGGCSSVPGGVADTRGMVTLLLAGLAALGIKKRKAAVKSKE